MVVQGHQQGSMPQLTPQSIMGLSLVSAAGAAAQSAVKKAAAGAARGGRNAELHSKADS